MKASTHPWARIREAQCLTQSEVAEHLNVTRQTVIRLEQGLFHQPSAAILEGLKKLYERDDLLKSYNEYVRVTRRDFGIVHQSFTSILGGLKPYQLSVHPLVYYRDRIDVTRMGLCRGLCLDYAPVADFEYNRQKSTPEGLITAAKAIHWDLGELERAVREWRIKWR